MKNIAVFAYSFPHRKTQDFLVNLVAMGYTNLCVIGAPWKKLAQREGENIIERRIMVAAPHAAEKLCRAMGLSYFETEHDDEIGIKNLQKQYDFKIGIIAGSRILQKKIIDIFPEGIINFHPGKIPETSGLDAFFYSIKHKAPMGVTAHFIDHKVDAGSLILFKSLKITLNDSPDIVQENLHHLQVTALRKVVHLLMKNERLNTTPILRPKKNIPMAVSEKLDCLKTFPLWRAEQYRRQLHEELINACEKGEKEKVQQILGEAGTLIEMPNDKGWTPLIVAAFHQKIEVVQLLLELGAEPNKGGLNGTTPLMYAKTSLINMENPDFRILDELVKHGADPKRTDAFGKDIYFYINQEKSQNVIEYFEKLSGK